MKELDLHDLSHDRVKDIVSSWVHENPPPCKIITGNSNVMEKLVREALEKKYRCDYESYRNLGALIVTRR
jgi:hypothetical protein|tara:strand:- start:11 stop:220 length:210 start_codon:yes stop_codon:yes gene_type:complete